MKVVVVESPAKAKTINKYLGSGYEVLASFGHVRDLPPKDGSVDPDHDFKMLWEVDDKSNKRLNDIARAVKDADTLILATDPDREGEAISWHVLEVLKQKNALKKQNVERVVFNPGYTYNPKINFKQGANDKILDIPPGPNGPVGNVWMALSKPTYGIHGTPEPSKIGKSQSHGCVRLTNWDANELAHMVKPGVTVEFVE